MFQPFKKTARIAEEKKKQGVPRLPGSIQMDFYPEFVSEKSDAMPVIDRETANQNVEVKVDSDKCDYFRANRRAPGLPQSIQPKLFSEYLSDNIKPNATIKPDENKAPTQEPVSADGQMYPPAYGGAKQSSTQTIEPDKSSTYTCDKNPLFNETLGRTYELLEKMYIIYIYKNMKHYDVNRFREVRYEYGCKDTNDNVLFLVSKDSNQTVSYAGKKSNAINVKDVSGVELMRLFNVKKKSNCWPCLSCTSDYLPQAFIELAPNRLVAEIRQIYRCRQHYFKVTDRLREIDLCTIVVAYKNCMGTDYWPIYEIRNEGRLECTVGKLISQSSYTYSVEFEDRIGPEKKLILIGIVILIVSFVCWQCHQHSSDLLNFAQFGKVICDCKQDAL